MRKLTFVTTVATTLLMFSQAQALPLGPVLAPVAESHDSSAVQVYYYGGHHYRYRYHGHYYRYRYGGHYYNHRYYRGGRYRYY
jgi:hypothetical protein